jgi:L-lactate dehydrogenase complex protein LldG
MSSRDAILGAIRANRPAPSDLPDVPLFDEGRGDDLLGRFFAAFQTMGGKVLELGGDGDGDPLANLRVRLASAGDVVSRVPEIAGNRDLDPALPPSSLADVDIAIVRAVFGVAETGSIALSERELGVNTLAYLAQHLIVLLDPADLVINIHHAYQRPEFAQSRYLVFHTGPSATADIEGVLIHGAQGVRSLSILPLPRG